MPLPSDETLVQSAKDLISLLHTGNKGPHPGYRPAHAKGRLLTGTFTPTPLAATLSAAPHFTHPSTPVLARFSASTGLPAIPDSDPNGNPRALSVRFSLPDGPDGRRRHTDIITHSTPMFPVGDAASAHAFFTAAILDHAKLATLIQEDEYIREFVSIPKPTPKGFDTQPYFSVNAFTLISAAGTRTNIRYRFVPTKPEAFYTNDEAGALGADFLADALEAQVNAAGQPVEMKLVAQVAEEGDVVDDARKRWPETREVVELGRLVLNKLVAEEGEDAGKETQKNIIYDPVPRVEGVEGAGDPLLELRAAVYLLSGRERRAA